MVSDSGMCRTKSPLPQKRSEMPLVKWVSPREKDDEVIINGGRSTDGGRRDVPPTTKRTWLAWDAGANGWLRGLSFTPTFYQPAELHAAEESSKLQSLAFASVPFGPPQGPDQQPHEGTRGQWRHTDGWTVFY